LAMAHRAQTQERIDRTSREMIAAHEALEALRPVDDLSDRSAEVQTQLDAFNVERTRVIELISRGEAELRGLNDEISRISATLKGALERQTKTKSLHKTVVSHETTAEHLTIVKEKLIGQIIPSLNERASALVDLMTDGKYTEISLTPDYEIEYRTSFGEYKNFLNLSGGEQTVFALALRVAIADLRAGNLGVLFLDEAMSSLSSEDGRQESVWQAIESLTSRFRQVFLITHVDAYRDRASYTVRM